MLRLRLPGGRITPSQWLAAETLSDQFGNGTLKLTTRQAIQIHGVVKQDLKQTMKDIHHAAITTIAASGDATRNVMVSLHPEDSGIHETVFNQAQELSRKLEPQTHAYHEIWLDAKRIYSGEEEEPLYGPGYLPRKFKIAFTLPPENDVDVYAQDLSFVAIEKEGKLLGYDILAGGGMGYAYGNPGSFPRLADIIGFCFPEQVEEVARQVLLIHKEFSTRSNRKHPGSGTPLPVKDWAGSLTNLQHAFHFLFKRPNLFHYLRTEMPQMFLADKPLKLKAAASKIQTGNSLKPLFTK